MPLEVCRWPVRSRYIFSSGQTWHTVVDSGGGHANDSEIELWSVLWVSVHDFLLSAARTGGWGLGTYVARCIINQCIYDCDVFSSFFHLYNPYEPSESEKKLIVTDSLTQKGGLDLRRQRETVYRPLLGEHICYDDFFFTL